MPFPAVPPFSFKRLQTSSARPNVIAAPNPFLLIPLPLAPTVARPFFFPSARTRNLYLLLPSSPQRVVDFPRFCQPLFIAMQHPTFPPLPERSKENPFFPFPFLPAWFATIDPHPLFVISFPLPPSLRHGQTFSFPFSHRKSYKFVSFPHAPPPKDQKPHLSHGRCMSSSTPAAPDRSLLRSPRFEHTVFVYSFATLETAGSASSPAPPFFFPPD